MLGGKESFWYGKEKEKKREAGQELKKMQKKRTKTREGPEGEDNMDYLMTMMV